MTTRVLQTTRELDDARSDYRNHVIQAEKLQIMDRATDELTRSGIRSGSLKEGHQIEDFILMNMRTVPPSGSSECWTKVPW
jgi:hypothetical protein